jgi:HEAT repeat protein
VPYYEQLLRSRSAITRASAADKLGSMQSAGSVPKLAPLLALDNPEIVSVAMRSLGRIGTGEALEAVLQTLPRIEERLLVSRKTVQAALEQFSHVSPDLFVRYGKANAASPRVVAAILGALAALPKNAAAVAFAAENLASKHPEVRAKALRMLGSAGGLSRGPAVDADLAVPLLRDPVWFVRVQAARALQNVGDGRAARPLGTLLFDGNWQVRMAAAAALTALGPQALDVFLEALRHDDRYARESVCEAIERSRFTDRLFEHLGGADTDLADKARAVLTTMHALEFSTPLRDYAERGTDEWARETVKRILAGEVSP